MNQKGFANVVLIGVIGILVIALGYFIFLKRPVSEIHPQISDTDTSPKLQTSSLSSAYIYGPESNKVKVFLYAEDEKKSVANGAYCGSAIGSMVHSGNYKLILDPSTATSDNPGGNSDMTWNKSSLDIGYMEFEDATPWDGQLIIDQFDPAGYKNFIVIQQYGSCNGNRISIYGYDFSQKKLVQYRFIPKDNSSQSEVFATSFKKSSSGNLVTSFYSNAVGKTETTEWIFNSSKDAFIAGPELPSGVSKNVLPATCKEETGGAPVITSISSYVGWVGMKLEIKGCNLAGFEGDKNAWIESISGEKGILYGEAGSTSGLIKVTLKSPLCQKDTSYSGLPCDTKLALNSGTYKIYVSSWGKESNKVDFTLQPGPPTSEADAAIWKTYINSQYAFEFKYPKSYSLLKDVGGYLGAKPHFVSGGEIIIAADMPWDSFPGPNNFDDAFFAVALKEKSSDKECQKAYEYGTASQLLTKTQTINGINFYKGVASEAGLGHQASDIFYHAYHNQICYELIEGLRTQNGADNITEYIKDKDVFGKLDEILNTFKFTK